LLHIAGSLPQRSFFLRGFHGLLLVLLV
jgi:hypothetical protein